MTDAELSDKQMLDAIHLLKSEDQILQIVEDMVYSIDKWERGDEHDFHVENGPEWIQYLNPNAKQGWGMDATAYVSYHAFVSIRDVYNVVYNIEEKKT